MNDPLALYIHIPFCVAKCRYCDFYSIPVGEIDPDFAHRFGKALLAELARYADNPRAEGRSLSSIYIGGGTPTLLPGRMLAKVLQDVAHHFPIKENAEVTVEVNPGTADKEKLRKLRDAGANRLSIGMQTRDDQLLKQLGRIHSFADFLAVYEAAREAGFSNINVDMMYGLPGESPLDVQNTLQVLKGLHPEHISTYCLTVEEGTPLFADISAGRLVECDQEIEEEMYFAVREELTGAGYHHYEISNFAQPGYESRHNLTYWHNREYLGIGPSAWSYLGGTRYQNHADIVKYMMDVQDCYPISFSETSSLATRMGETIILGLRLLDGFDVREFASRFGRSIDDVYGREINSLQEAGYLIRGENRIRLSPEVLFVSNQVLLPFVNSC